MGRRRGFEEEIKRGDEEVKNVRGGKKVEGRQRGRGGDREKEGSRWWRN